ncbi:LPS export ABC transporter periplasmic protein LptC [Omnitrophica bacterium]|nr:LPS export ABC transporter periplasmic protein LptC [Candidatus Omnitrophota bacterium]
MKKDKFLIVLVSSVIIAGLVFFGRGKTPPERASRMDEMPRELDQKILSFELANYSDNGIKSWKLKGDSADILAEIVNLSNIDMETYDEPRITLTALFGTYNKRSKEVSLFQDVEVLTSDGAMLTTDYLKWDGKTDTITTDEPVRMIKSDVITRGTGALAMPQMKKIILDKNIRVRLTTDVIDDIDEMSYKKNGFDGAESSRPTNVTITCDGPLVIDYEKNIAVFEDNVLVDDQRGKIYSDKMEAFLDPASKNIIKVVAEGSVRVVRGGDCTYSEKAIYTTEDQKIILVGKPRIYIQPTEEIEGLEKEFGGI